MDETKQMARFAAELALETVPVPVVDHAKRLILDQFGVQIACARYPWSQAVYSVLSRRSGAKESSVVVYGDRVAAETAAFINSVFGHAIEFDDIHSRAMTHPGCVVIPAAVAMAERQQATGSQFLASAIVGIEVMCRVAWSVSPHLLARGHHSPPAAGPFGVAASAGRLLGFDASTMLEALAVSSSYSGGLMEYTQSGGAVKRIHGAIPAQGGIQAALLAEAGLTGPHTALEGVRGFLQVFAGQGDLGRLTAGLGENFILAETSIKPYACNASIHPALDALSIIRQKHGVTAAEVEKITAGISVDHIVRVGAIREPTDILGAQFSLPFSLALSLVKNGNNPADYSEENLIDPTVRELARRVFVEVDEEVERTRGVRYSAVVTVQTRAGDRYQERVLAARGTPERPMTQEEVEKKFLGLAIPVIGRAKAERIVTTVNDLERAPDLRDLGEAWTVQG